MRALRVVIDPGHGGTAAAGRSTPNRVVGPGGTLEKDLTLDLARLTRRVLTGRGHTAILTRDGDLNPTLAERARIAWAHSADAFVSIHLNGAADPAVQGTETWGHEDASPASRALAAAVLRRVGQATTHVARGVYEGRLAILDPRYHRTDTAACLVEVSFLTDPHEEERLAQDAYRGRLADALARGIEEGMVRVVSSVREAFDVWHEVPLVPQLTGMSCWAAAAAMLVGWRECVDVDPREVALGSGRWAAFRDGLEPEGVEALAQAWGLVLEPPHRYTVGALRGLLEECGPLWVGEASPGLHVVVVAGMLGDGTPDGTFVRVVDPWPVDTGQRYTRTFREFARNLQAAADLTGMAAQVLHTGSSRARGPRRVVSERVESYLRLGKRRPAQA